MPLLLCCVLAMSFNLRLRALRRADARTLAIRLQERSRLARELHDTLSRGMMTIHMKIQLASALLRDDPASAVEHLTSAVHYPAVCRGNEAVFAALRLEGDECQSFEEAVQRVVQTFRESCTIPLQIALDSGLPTVSEETHHELMQVIQEALTNVRLHSGAHMASLSIAKAGEELVVEVVDDGVGFASVDAAGLDHYGLIGMRERGQRIGGAVEIDSAAGEGTRVRLAVSLHQLMKHRV